MNVITDENDVVRAISLIPGLDEVPWNWHVYFPVMGTLPIEGSVFFPEPAANTHLYRGDATMESLRIQAHKFAELHTLVQVHMNNDGSHFSVHSTSKHESGRVTLGFLVPKPELIAIHYEVTGGHRDSYKMTANDVEFQYKFTSFDADDFSGFVRAGIAAAQTQQKPLKDPEA